MIRLPGQFLVLFAFLLASALLTEDLNATPSKNQTSLERAKVFVFEHPQKAIEFGQEALKAALTQNQNYDAAIALTTIARAYGNLADYTNAKIHIDSALNIVVREADLGKTIEVTKVKINLLALNGYEKEALLEIDRLSKLAIRREEDPIHLTNLLLFKGEYFRQQRKFEEALKSQNEALGIAKKLEDKNLLAECYKTLGSTYYQQSKFSDALDWYNKALQVAIDTDNTTEQISVLRNMSLANRDLGQLDAAGENLLSALSLATKANNAPLKGEVYNLIGSLYLRMGKTNEALENYNQSLLIREDLGFLLSVAATLENISRVQRDINLYNEAFNNLKRVIEIRTELKDARSLGSAYNEMGNLMAQKGELADALMYYLTSLKIRQEANLESDISRSLINIGLMYRRMGSHRNAQKYFEQALELISDKTDLIGKALVYIHLGNTLRDLTNPNQALTYYRKALDLRRATGNKLAISQSMRSMSNALSDLNNFQEADSYLLQALDILKELGDERAIADTYNELGNLKQKEGKLDRALTYFNDASNLYAKNFELEKRGLCLRKIGEIQVKLGRYNEAYENLQLAKQLAEKTRNHKLLELTLLALHDYYAKKGLFQEALNTYYQHINLRDSLNAILQKESIWQASLDLELDKKAGEIRAMEGEVESLRAEAQLKSIQLQQQKLIRNFIALVLLFALIVAIGSVYGYLIIRKKNFWLNEANEKLAKSEADLKKLVQTKDKLFSIIAHDLRSPFTALVGLTEVLSHQAEQLEKNEVAEYSSLIHESSEKLLNLIENLLHWSRSQTGKIQIIPKELQLNSLVSEVISVLEMQAKAKEIKLVTDIDPNLAITGDYDTISTVIRNLTSNAIKFSNTGGVVSINASQSNGTVRLSVTDTGVGISPENIGKLFKIEDSFSTKGTSQEAGTGLGLIVCKEFIEKNGGYILVDSTLGQGTTFTITIPKSNTDS